MENSSAGDYLHPFSGPGNFPFGSATDFPPQGGQMAISALGIGGQLFINDWTRSKAVN